MADTVQVQCNRKAGKTNAAKLGLPAPAVRLWVNEGGEIACDRHGGAYLTSAIQARPRARTHSTPLGSWHMVSDYALLAAAFAQDGLPTPACETCGVHPDLPSA